MRETRNTLAAMKTGKSVVALPNSTEQALAEFGAVAESTITDGLGAETGDLGVVPHRFD